MTMPGMEIVRHLDFDASGARAITDQIRSSMGDLMMLVVKAHQGRVWIALGYESWPEYIKGEFDHAPLSLPRDERKAVVALLRGQGMSTRAIAPTVGQSRETVRRDLAPDTFVSGDDDYVLADFCDDEDEVAAISTMAEVTNQEFESVLDIARAEGDLSRRNVARLCVEAITPPITGLDGKTYQPKPPVPLPDTARAKPRRGPITDDFGRAVSDLTRLTTRIEKLAADDRFGRNREALDGRTWDLIRAIQAIAPVIEQLKPDLISVVINHP
jgi:hypothetical protein